MAVALVGVLSAHGTTTAAAPDFVKVADGTALDGSGFTLTASSSANGHSPQLADDGQLPTYWESAAALPQSLTVDTGTVDAIGGLRYTPPPAGATTNVLDYVVQGSTDGATFTDLASGTWADDADVKTVTFDAAQVRFVRLVGSSSTGSAVAASELELLAPEQATAAATPPDHPGWAIAVDSTSAGYPGTNAIDSDTSTSWVSASGAFPHTATIDTGAEQTWSELRYTPPSNGLGTIGSYRVSTSDDGSTWTVVASGTLNDDTDQKNIAFVPTQARYVRLAALSSAGNRSSMAGAAELDLVQGTAPSPGTPSTGRWTAPINFPIIPAAVAMLPNGKVLAWSSDGANAYGGNGGATHTVVYDPATGSMAHVVVTNTGQDMFCPGIAMLPDGRVAVFGGHYTATRISVYDAAKDHWSPARPMALTRGYEASVTQADGTVFTIGGSWSDTNNVKDGEVWTASQGSHLLSGTPVAPMLTTDKEGTYRADNHGWLFTWGTRVFQAGPSKHLNWYSTKGAGGHSSAGLRGDDEDAMNGAAVMYSPGKILTVGGAPDYTGTPATPHANLISITGSSPVVTKLAPMHFARSFASAVVLPNGKVFISGGMQNPKTFSDATAVMTPELWDPATQTFSDMAEMQVPRTYHSEALLLADGRVLVGGGGLCGPIADCQDVNHADAQIWSPPYLFNSNGTPASRPMITSAPTTSYAGHTINVKTNTAISQMVLIRASAVTHSVNTDQRRMPVGFSGTPARGYNIVLPKDRGVMVPGAYLLFAMNSKGVPSVARIITIR